MAISPDAAYNRILRGEDHHAFRHRGGAADRATSRSYRARVVLDFADYFYDQIEQYTSTGGRCGSN
jgi:hypothetical protein